MKYFVAIYLVDRAYGGPEEGGWYYDYGVPDEDFSDYTRWFDTEHEAEEYSFKLDHEVCPGLNAGRPPVSSVLSEGYYTAIIHEGEPTRFPERRPHYE